jgi:hypothetical protein
MFCMILGHMPQWNGIVKYVKQNILPTFNVWHENYLILWQGMVYLFLLDYVKMLYLLILPSSME